MSTRKTPAVKLSGGRFTIEGRSIPENPRAFYLPLHDWMLEKFGAVEGRPLIEFGFEYINTASAKWIFLILKELSSAGKEFQLVWYYEKGDEDMLELGLMLRNLIGCHFSAIEVDEIQNFRKI
jgi:hypothetical protein